MTEFEKELVIFVSGYLDAGVSAEDYVKAFSQRLLDSIGRQSKPEPSEDVEEAAENYAYGESNDKYQGFVDGASWQKEQMMKEAVEGYLVTDGLNNLQVNTANLGDRGYYQGQKVRVIIVNEEEKPLIK